MMRIVGGSLSGRRFPGPKDDSTRPTPERVREAVSNALEARGRVKNAVVLDLFSGTGALAFEMLSRGASSAVAVDSSKVAAARIRKSAEDLGLAGGLEVLCLNLLSASDTTARRVANTATAPFDLVFADAPYKHTDQVPALLAQLKRGQAFSEDVCVVVEHDRKHVLNPPFGLASVAEYRYGDTTVSLLGPPPIP